MAKLFEGQKLMRKKGEKNFVEASAEELQNKVVALYFSAHWCPPCRMFTPLLKEFYNELADEGEFEVVFVSFDRAESDLHTYLNEAHGDWCFLPFKSPFIEALSKQYGVSGIPALIIIKPDGTTIESNARSAVQGQGDAPIVTLNNWKTACGF